MRPSFARWVAFLERHHRRVVLGSAVLALLCGLSLLRLRLDIDVLSMLPQGSPAFDEFRSFVGDFGELNQLVVLVDGPDLPQLQHFADEMAVRLQALDSIAQVQARIDVDRVLAGLLGRRLYEYIPEKQYEEIRQRLTPAGIDTQVEINRAILSAPFDLSASQAVMQDPLGLRRLAGQALAESYAGAAPSLGSGYFTSTDGHALLLLARPTASAFDIIFTENLMRQAHAAEDEARHAIGEGAGAIRVAYTGSYVYALEDADTLRWDIGRYTVLSLLGILAVFYAGYRNLRILPFATYPLLLTTLLTFALSLLFFRELNALSLCFAAILYGLSIDSAIHYYTRVLQERGSAPSVAAAVRATLAGLGPPDAAGSATTAVAFLVVGTSILTPVSQIGWLTAIGMIVSTALFFILFPALTFWLRPTFAASARPPDTLRLERWARFSAEHARPIAAGTAVLAMVLLFLARGVQLDVALTHLRPSTSEAVRVQAEIEKRFGVTQASGAVVLRNADLDHALADAEQVAQRLRLYREEGQVQQVEAIDGALPSAGVQRARLRLFNQLPRREAARILRQSLVQHGFATAKFEPFLESFVAPRDEDDVIRLGDPDLAPLASLVNHHVQAHGGEYIVATYLEPAPGASVGEIARRLRADLPDLGFGVASRALLEEELAQELRRELVWFGVLAVVGNLILLLLSFRHFGTALAVLAPVALVVTALFAGMAVTGVALDPVNLIVTPLIFGIGVDYGIYVAARARECGDVAGALRLSGRAIVVSALTTVAGFGFLALSRYPFLASMGLLTGIGLSLCLILSIVLVPALLVVLGRKESR